MAQKNEDDLAKLLEVLSHDIRNPLSIVLGQLEVQADSFKEKGENLPKWLEKTSRAAAHMESILNLVRDIRALDTGKIQLDLVPIKLKDVFHEVKFLFEDKLNAKKQTLEFENKDKDDNLAVLAEKTSLCHQVMNNIVSNAIKFSPLNTKIKIDYMSEGDLVRLEIIDSGMGMPKEYVENIFRSDTKTSRKGTQWETGTGFGMPLAKRYMEAFGGTIKVESKDVKEFPTDAGTKFILHLKKA